MTNDISSSRTAGPSPRGGSPALDADAVHPQGSADRSLIGDSVALGARDPGVSADAHTKKVKELTHQDEDKFSEELAGLVSGGELSPGEADQIMAFPPIVRRKVLSAILNGKRLAKVSLQAREAGRASDLGASQAADTIRRATDASTKPPGGAAATAGAAAAGDADEGR